MNERKSHFVAVWTSDSEVTPSFNDFITKTTSNQNGLITGSSDSVVDVLNVEFFQFCFYWDKKNAEELEFFSHQK